jgi:hypothetical protein
MMRKLLPLTALALGLSSGVALADHRSEYREAMPVRRVGPPVVRDHRDWRGGTVVVRDGRNWYGGSRLVVRGRPSYYPVVRRPIYVARPIIRERYFNYYRRPALIVENYNAMPGYYWVAGSWSWNGYEWIWQPGHYEPDPNYVDSGYVDSGYADPGCDHSYYNQSYDTY